MKREAFAGQRVVIVGLAVGWQLFWSTTMLVLKNYNPLPYLAGTESKDRFLHRTLGTHYLAYRFMEDHLPRDARVLLVGEHRTLYCPRHYLAADWFDTQPFVLMCKASRSEEELMARLQTAGVTHILYNPGEIAKWRDRMRSGYADGSRILIRYTPV